MRGPDVAGYGQAQPGPPQGLERLYSTMGAGVPSTEPASLGQQLPGRALRQTVGSGCRRVWGMVLGRFGDDAG